MEKLKHSTDELYRILCSLGIISDKQFKNLAKLLGLHPRTAYNILKRKRLIKVVYLFGKYFYIPKDIKL